MLSAHHLAALVFQARNISAVGMWIPLQRIDSTIEACLTGKRARKTTVITLTWWEALDIYINEVLDDAGIADEDCSLRVMIKRLVSEAINEAEACGRSVVVGLTLVREYLAEVTACLLEDAHTDGDGCRIYVPR